MTPEEFYARFPFAADPCTQCGLCESFDVTELCEPVERVWGSPDSPHGEHGFTVMQAWQRCNACGGEWLDGFQARAVDELLNDQIKATLGFDWLAANAEYRAANGGSRRKRPTPPEE
jgi:hypothetical protein